MKIVVAGGNGFVGYALVKRLLRDGHSVVALSRRLDAFKNVPNERLAVVLWDGIFVGVWAAQLEEADAVINLAGVGIADKPWNVERKRLIKASRLAATQAIVNAMARCIKRPKVLVNASAVGFYGSVPEGDVTEASPRGRGFLAEVCADWEREAEKAGSLGVRVVLLRLGVVIGKGGGALQKMMTPFKLFVGGPLGSGRQWFPWVHREDVIGAIVFSIKNASLSGPVNVTAPGTLTMKEFCRTLGRALKRPCWAPVPGFILRLVLGEMSSMLLTGQKVMPAKLLDAGYVFEFPEAGSALEDLLRK